MDCHSSFFKKLKTLVNQEFQFDPAFRDRVQSMVDRSEDIESHQIRDWLEDYTKNYEDRIEDFCSTSVQNMFDELVTHLLDNKNRIDEERLIKNQEAYVTRFFDSRSRNWPRSNIEERHRHICFNRNKHMVLDVLDNFGTDQTSKLVILGIVDLTQEFETDFDEDKEGVYYEFDCVDDPWSDADVLKWVLQLFADFHHLRVKKKDNSEWADYPKFKLIRNMHERIQKMSDDEVANWGRFKSEAFLRRVLKVDE